jgi:thiol-disulfide isomerase/thioredoxin/uncharacterized membrane protein YphA (DoxX/SURF4 family)
MIAVLIIARFLLTVVFAVAGTTKIADPAGTRKALADFGVPEFLVRSVAVLLPLLELALAIALIPAASAGWAAAGVFAMLSLFTAAIGVNLARGRAPDCHCFGQLHSEPIGWKTIMRNAALAIVSALVVWQQAKHPGLSVVDAFEGFSRIEFAFLALAALAAFQLWFSLHLLRQNGRLFLRMEALEAKQAPSPQPPPPGLPINTPAPEFSLRALEGIFVTLAELMEESKSLVLAFVEPGCAHCDTLLPELAQWQEEHHDRISIVVISRGGVEPNRAKIRGLNLRNVLMQKNRETAESYMVTVTPTAVLLTNGQIASALAEGIDAIRSLVGRAILPPAVKKGDSAPSLVLADLTGNSVDLATLRGRRSLLLFWNPSCGFCQQMLPNVKTWENDRGDDSPELLVISSGSFEAIRAQGFRSRVLLDPHWGANQVFGAGGTPSAVLIDEDGKVASEVGAGADDVWALAGAVRSATAKA